MYDVLCTLHYNDDGLAMYIDNVRRTNRVTAERIANEAVRWGLSRETATQIIEELLDKAPEAIASARNETGGIPGEFVSVVEGQIGTAAFG